MGAGGSDKSGKITYVRLPRLQPSPVVLVVAVGLVGWGDFFTYGMYSPSALRLVTSGCIALGLGVVVGFRRVDRRTGVVAAALAALVVWQGIVLVRATNYYGTGHWLKDARFVSLSLFAIGAAAVVAPQRRWLWPLLAVAFTVGSFFSIWSSPRPAIDVWFLLQHASSCVVHGCNPYTMHTPRSPGVTNGFNYLPATAVLLEPFHAVFGDVRYGELAAIVAAALVLHRMTRRAAIDVVPLFLCLPGLFFAVEQAWTESLLVLLLVGALAWAEQPQEGRWAGVGAGVLLGLALATKQHMWLLLPVAAITLRLRITAVAVATGVVCILPWFLADPHALWQGTVTEFTDIAPRIDATTLWLHEPRGWQTALALVVLGGCYVLAWLSCRGDVHRFLLGSAVVLAGFDLMNKQSFFNQWMLVSWLVIAAVAVELRESRHDVSIVTREVSPIGA
jgi:hypothetical protein